jgi:uncharacterized protein (DUF2236 family)
MCQVRLFRARRRPLLRGPDVLHRAVCGRFSAMAHGLSELLPSTGTPKSMEQIRRGNSR